MHGAGTTGRYRFPGLWCLHFYRYHGELALDGRPLTLAPGTVGFTPPGATAVYRWTQRSRHGYAHFALPVAGPHRSLPLLTALGDAFEPLYQAFAEGVAAWPTTPQRAEVRLWDLLWQLAERAPAAPGATALHPALQEAVRQLELRLAEPLRVPDLARAVGLSHNHLTRLWRAAFGTTVVGYLRRRRAEQARHLLRHSTQPLRTIAADLGLRDVQQLNKLVRRELGVCPSRLRSQAGEER